MGQQQLLLIVLGIIIVGIAIAVGVNMFQQSAVDTNRQSIISDLTNLAAKAQRFYRTPQELGGGAQNFQGFALGRLDTSNANGSYRVYASGAPTGPAPKPAYTTNITITTSVIDTIWLCGWGQEDGDVATSKVMALTAVAPSGIQTTILN
jgi:type II secretory pathway pseudopilin PulG